MKTLLLTGWTGYIWSHCAALLLEQGYEVIILDNLSNSSEEVIEKIHTISGKIPKFYKWDIKNVSDIESVFSENTIDAVIHFAGAKSVSESCVNPFEYYENNIVWTIHLTEVMEKYWVKNIIFSSSATVYNPLETPPFHEETPTGNTTNPYGTTKFLIENILRDLSIHKGFNVINLRYFNPIGAHASGLIGEDPNDIPNNLLPYVMKVASGELPKLFVFWDDYDTIDGSWVRDYIHVTDLAHGHVAALKYIAEKIDSSTVLLENINLWTGNGTSVFEIIQATEKVIWASLPYEVTGRRAWDIASAYCCNKKAKDILGWEAKLTVQEAIADSWNFIKNK